MMMGSLSEVFLSSITLQKRHEGNQLRGGCEEEGVRGLKGERRCDVASR